MTIINIKYHCGCGQSYDEIGEAVKHSEEKGHSMTILGTITSEAPKKQSRASMRAIRDSDEKKRRL